MAKTIKRAIIIGGGIGGVCTAIGLHQAGIEAVIYEQAERLSQVGAGLTLWANAIKGLRKIGVADKVIRSGSKIERAEIRTASGNTLSRSQPGELEALFGEPTVAIHRADLHNILLAELPANGLRLGAKCLGFEQDDNGVTARFSNNETDRADLLIGADGIHSVIRRQLFPELTLRYSGYTAWRGVVATTDEAALGLTSESWGRGSRFGILRIDKERIYWFSTANRPAGETLTTTAQKELLQQLFKGWHHPIEMLVSTTPAEEILHNDIYDMRPIKQWGVGRVILLGDAAHPTTPNLGQGACMAIESSVSLTRALTSAQSLAASLDQYQRERMPRTNWITEQSRQIGRVGQWQHPLACLIRDLLVKLTPDKVMRKTLEKAAGYEV